MLFVTVCTHVHCTYISAYTAYTYITKCTLCVRTLQGVCAHCTNITVRVYTLCLHLQDGCVRILQIVCIHCVYVYLQGVCVHCMAGVGRTGTMLAVYLVKSRGLSAQQAIQEVRRQRPGSIETQSQEEAVFIYTEYIKGAAT